MRFVRYVILFRFPALSVLNTFLFFRQAADIGTVQRTGLQILLLREGPVDYHSWCTPTLLLHESRSVVTG